MGKRKMFEELNQSSTFAEKRKGPWPEALTDFPFHISTLSVFVSDYSICSFIWFPLKKELVFNYMNAWVLP